MIGCTHSAPSLTGRAGGESFLPNREGGGRVLGESPRYVLAPVAVLSGAGVRTPVSLISFAKILLFRVPTKIGGGLRCKNLLTNGAFSDKNAGRRDYVLITRRLR